jgi:hypothetical protein
VERKATVESGILQAHGGTRTCARGAEFMAPPGMIDHTKAATPHEAAKE